MLSYLIYNVFFNYFFLLITFFFFFFFCQVPALAERNSNLSGPSLEIGLCCDQVIETLTFYNSFFLSPAESESDEEEAD